MAERRPALVMVAASHPIDKICTTAITLAAVYARSLTGGHTRGGTTWDGEDGKTYDVVPFACAPAER